MIETAVRDQKACQPQGLLCDSRLDPVAVEGANPFLSWIVPLCEIGMRQTAWQVLAATSPAMLTESQADLWNSGRVDSEQSTDIEYKGLPLNPGQACYWSVRIWDNHQQPSLWSEAAIWRKGLGAHDWQAKWIGTDEVYQPELKQLAEQSPYYCADDFEQGENILYLPPPAYLRKDFTVGRPAREAILYVSAFGLVETTINGQRVTDSHFVPGWSDYRKRVYYRAFDVTSLINAGENAIGVILADGWYAGYVGLNPRNQWGQKPRAMVELVMLDETGRTQVICSDESWKASQGGIRYSDILHGEYFDAALEPQGWNEPGFTDCDWNPVETGAEIDLLPVLHPGPPVVEHAKARPVSSRKMPDGSLIIDFGQCMSGYVRLTVTGQKGASVSIQHAEMLDDDGDLYLRGNRSARATDTYVLGGLSEEAPNEAFLPRFTYHGFQYVKITGLGEVARLVDIEAVAIGSAQLQETEFSCDSPVINRVVDMIRWTLRSNLFEVPTDVCARDERLGWGAEGHFILYTASLFGNQKAFLRKWLNDITDSQLDNGCFWPTAPALMMPDINQFCGDIQSDHGLHVTWLLYQRYGDLATLAKSFPALDRHFQFIAANHDRLIRMSIGGDWLALNSECRSDEVHGFGDCPQGILGTAYFARSAQMMAVLADALGLSEKASQYRQIGEAIKKSFRQFYLQKDLTLRGATQGAYLLAIEFDLLPEAAIGKAKKWLVQDIYRRGSPALTCGTSTLPFAFSALSRLGLKEVAVDILASEQFPGLGYMAKHGATTIWERWDAIRPDGRYHPQPMNAFNHIGLATPGEWIVSGLAGIRGMEPGFKKFLISPCVTSKVQAAHAAYRSPFGTIVVDWKWQDREIELNCTVPANTTAIVQLPGDPDCSVQVLEGASGIVAQTTGKMAEISVVPGWYRFSRACRLV